MRRCWDVHLFIQLNIQLQRITADLQIHSLPADIQWKENHQNIQQFHNNIQVRFWIEFNSMAKLF